MYELPLRIKQNQMNYIEILLPLLISGLGVYTYKHPKESRGLIIKLMIVIFIVSVLVVVYRIVKNDAYYEAMKYTNFDIYISKRSNLSLDSLYKSVHDRDSINLILRAEKEINQFDTEMIKNQTAVQDSIRSKIRFLVTNVNQFYYDAGKYCLSAMVVLIILFLLSFQFEKLNNKD